MDQTSTEFRPSSPASSSVSLKSDHSRRDPPNFSRDRPSSPAYSDVSLKSDHSRRDPPNFSGAVTKAPLSANYKSLSLCGNKNSTKNLKILQTRTLKKYQNDVKEKLDTEIYEMKAKTVVKKIDTLFKDGRTVLTTGVAGIGKTFQAKNHVVDWAKQRNPKTQLKIFFNIEKFNSRKKLSIVDLLNDCFEDVNPSIDYSSYNMTIILDGLDKCDVPLDFENNRKLTDITETAPVNELLTNLIQGNLLPSAQLWILTRPSRQDKIPEQYIHTVTECRENEKRRQMLILKLEKQFPKTFVFKEDLSHPNQKNTEHIRTDREGENGRKLQITTSDLFKKESNNPIRTVLTTGEAEVGKTYLVRKFIHNWATTGNSWPFSARKEKTVLFPLTFLLLKEVPSKLSFVDLLNQVFTETKQCVMSDYNKLSCVFILDGLEDFKLDWTSDDTVRDVYEPAPVTVLLSSLIRGDLLPSALVWILSRPAAAELVPSDLLHRTTHIREKPDLVSQRNLKRALLRQYEWVAEGVDRGTTKKASLRDIYTDLYIIEGDQGEVYQKSEARLVQRGKNIEVRKEIPINYADIFKASADRPNEKIKTVLTIGVAGIGKTFASMKYMLDWAEGASSHNVNMTFPLPFRELNLRKDMELSWEELLNDFFPCMKTSEITDYNKYKVLIVLDGLDECRLELDLSQQQKWSDIKQKMPVNDLLSNLIIGNLLPEAQVWITSRPTALRSEKVLCYVKESRCIFLMCHIPVFCWIAAKVLEAFVQNGHQGIPKTLTDLFVHFLLLQCKQANAKYNQTTDEDSTTWNERNVKCVVGLSQMAFEGLEKGDLLFTEDDLISYGLDVKEASVYSGLLTRVRREESELYPEQFFSFVHLSIQEFLAAFYVSYTFNNEGENVFSTSDSSDQSASDFYKSAVDKALKSKNGDWDLFLRFLLGLSLKTNHDLLKEVLKTPENTEQINKEIIDYIKTKIDGEHSEEGCDADTSMNLFHCLNELNDRSLVEEIKKYLQADKKNYENFSRAKWAALTFVLLTSDQNLDEFDLKKYCKSETVLLGMVPVVKVAKKALLSWCELSERSCGALSSSILTSASSNLTELDLSHNELAGCRISEKGCAFLISALKGNKSSVLEKLDLSYNHPGPEEEKLKALKSDPFLAHCCEHRLKPGLRKYTADLTFDVNHKHPRIIVENQTARMREKVCEKIPETRGAVSVRQVFCEQELSGLCYWELEWEGTVGVGVCYKGAASKCVLGWDDMSWAVFTSNQSSSCLDFAKAAKQARSPKKPHRKTLTFPSQKMAVFLDGQAGILEYYSVTQKESAPM
ncbi:hypothetical protein WMY93_027215 [Mugilogobius chulae]|uniref:FISNA domain-containing protein n=1 Tax=Mugilogobius chulae TaxID=88201 RepID=A0AAW0MWP0_9GOBI